MSNQLTRLLLLPSVIIANASIVLGYPIEISNQNETNQYSQKLKSESFKDNTLEHPLADSFLTNTSSIEQIREGQINHDNNITLISLFSILILILSLKKIEHYRKTKQTHIFSSLVSEKVQFYKFNFIKTTSNIYHHFFHKHYINSLPD